MRDSRHRRRRLHRLPRRRPAGRRRTRRAGARRAAAARRTPADPDYLNPRRRDDRRPTSRDPRARPRRRSPASTRSVTRRRWSAWASTSRTRRRTCVTTISATAVLLARWRPARFRGRLVLASSMVVYGEGRYDCAVHGTVSPAPAGATTWRQGASSLAARSARAPLTAERGRPRPRRSIPATCTPPPRCTRSICARRFARESGATVIALRYHNVYGPRMPRDTPYAGVASIFASSLARGDAPRVFEDGGQLRDFVHVRDVARANVAALTAADARRGSRQRGQRSAAPHPGNGAARWPTPTAPAAPRPTVTGEFRLGDVRHVFASVAAGRGRARVPRRRRTSPPAWPSSPTLRCDRRRSRERRVAAGDRQGSAAGPLQDPPVSAVRARAGGATGRGGAAATRWTSSFATPAARRVLVLDGDPARWRRPGLQVIAQRGDGLARAAGPCVRRRRRTGAAGRDGHPAADRGAAGRRSAGAAAVRRRARARARRRLLERRPARGRTRTPSGTCR